MNLKTMDLHIHSSFSGCASRESSIGKIIKISINKGLKKIAITDHFFSYHPYFRGETNIKEFLRHLKEIKGIKNRYQEKIEVLAGVEIDVTDKGDIIAPDEIFEESEWILAGIHFHDGPIPFRRDYNAKEYQKRKNSMKKYGREKLLEEIMVAHIKVALNTKISTVAHPFENLVMSFLVELPEEIPYHFLRDFYKALKETKKVFEFNRTSFEVSTPEAQVLAKNYDFFVKMALSKKIEIVLGSDAHNLENIGNIPYQRLNRILSGGNNSP